MAPKPTETRSVWMDEALAQCAPLDADTKADVCIVGAGIAGLSTAYSLVRAGASVIVLEADLLGSGETCRTTAHLTHALDEGYVELERLHGADGAKLAAESHSAAIDRIESIVTAEGIDCAFARVDGYLFRGTRTPQETLDRELAAARLAGLNSVSLCEKAPLPSFDSGPALRFANQAQFHPLKYLAGLTRAIVAAGGRVCTRSRVQTIEDGEPARVVTTRGHTVTAQSIVVATNSPISDRLAIHTKQAAYRTYAIALAMERDSVPTALFWDTEDPYHYVRTHVQSDGQCFLIVGGEDHKTGQANDAEMRFARLESWSRERFAGVGTVEYRWSGQVMEPVDGLAFIGQDPLTQHVYVATGDSGHGMTHGTIAGMLIPDLILGRANPWAKLYAPNRKSAGAIRTYAKENLNVARMFGDYLKPGEVEDVADIAPGSGALLRHGAKILAVYRDEQGELHARSAVCTHVGCIVHWNGTERSWDCPCHGSRFNVDGEVLNGPANAPLAQASLDESKPPDKGDRPPYVQRV